MYYHEETVTKKYIYFVFFGGARTLFVVLILKYNYILAAVLGIIPIVLRCSSLNLFSESTDNASNYCERPRYRHSRYNLASLLKTQIQGPPENPLRLTRFVGDR